LREDRNDGAVSAGDGEGFGDGAGEAAVDWKRSITRNRVVCLECGAEFKQLSARHLGQHGLNGRTYREKYGIPRTQALAAKATTAARKKIVQQIRPWEKAPRFVEARERAEAEQKKVDASTPHCHFGPRYSR
jgi:predicted transcriptional regulator